MTEMLVGIDVQELVQKAEHAWDALDNNQGQWPELVLKTAQAFWRLRKTEKTNEGFGKLVKENEWLAGIDKDKRAALIHLGEYEHITKEVLVNTKSRCIRTIWDTEVKPKVTPVQKASPAASPQRKTKAANVAQSRRDTKSSKPPADRSHLGNATAAIRSLSHLHKDESAWEDWCAKLDADTCKELFACSASEALRAVADLLDSKLPLSKRTPKRKPEAEHAEAH